MGMAVRFRCILRSFAIGLGDDRSTVKTLRIAADEVKRHIPRTEDSVSSAERLLLALRQVKTEETMTVLEDDVPFDRLSRHSSSPRCSDNEDRWKGLIHMKPFAGMSFMYYPPPQLEYELTLDRPSLQQWYSQSQQQHSPTASSSWNDDILNKLMQMLGIQQEQNTATSQKRVTSLFVSMDIFSKVSSTTEEPLSNIEEFFSTLRQSFPQLQSIHLYNGPTPSSGLAFVEQEDHRDVEDELPIVWIRASTVRNLLSSNLQSFIATRCLYFPLRHDVQALADALRDCPKLTTFHLLSIYPNPTVTVNLNPLLLAASSQLVSLNITCCKADLTTTLLSSVLLLTNVDDGIDAPSEKLVSNDSIPMRDGLLSQRSIPENEDMISPSSLRHLLQKCPLLTDLTLWECQLHHAHLEAIQWGLLSDDGTVQSANPHDPTATGKQLRFLSLRENPGISTADWCRFYTEALPHCYSLQSIYNDHVCGLADCHPNLPVYGERDRTTGGLRFWDADTTATAGAELLLGLNALGRGSVIRSTYCNNDDDRNVDCSDALEAVLDLLSDVTDTPSAIYALIRNHPMMIVAPQQ
jgi:hypothetical protein